MTSTCASDRPLEVVDEDLLEPFSGVDRVVAEALQPRERRRVQAFGKKTTLVMLEPHVTSMAVE
jgi:hypothetical protein